MPRKDQRQAGLAKLKAARQNRGSASLLDDVLEQAADNDDDDVYEYVTEEDYAKLVESRRQREDFVVDDDGLGYCDDGEERLGDEQADFRDNNTTQSKQQKRRHANATLTSKALKKARKQKGTSVESSSNANSNSGSGGKNQSSMWAFVNKASSVTVSKPNTNNNNASSFSSLGAATSKNVDALLDTLDEPAVLQKRGSKRKKQSSHNKKRSSSAGRSSRKPAARSSRYSSSSSSSSYKRSHHQDVDHDNDHDFPMDDGGGGDDDDDVGGFDAFDDHDNDNEPASTFEGDRMETSTTTKKSPPTSTKKVHWKEDSEETNNNNNKDDEDDEKKQEKDDEEESAAAKPTRRRLSRPKLGLSKAAAVAQQQQQQHKKDAAAAQPQLDAPPTVTHRQSFQPVAIAAETGLSTATAGQMDLLEYLKNNNNNANNEQQEGGESYMDMYWMDLCERHGEIFLFGKVKLNDKQQFVSACVIVGGNVRNLFVLPKPDSSMMDVHGEINQVLHTKGILPRTAGSSWAGKPVQRQYAFADASIPREKTEYLKVVYDAKYPTPSADLCAEGGQHYAKILGAGASVIENFLVKRKLMGPCWVRIAAPKATAAPLSWCKVECRLDSPKQLQRLDAVVEPQNVPPPPPVTTLSIKLKTVVNPKTHKSEIVSISAVCHKNVQLETASDESTKHMTQLSLIRPLAMTDGGGGTTTMAQFPRDIDQEIAASMPQLRREPNERALLSRLFAQIGQWDPDVVVGHNAWGFDMEVLLTRCIDHKVKSWSRIGRRRRTELPSKTHFSSRKDLAIADAMSGRLLCDTYLSAKELLRETTYSLTNLAATQLKTNRQEIEPVDIPRWFQNSKTIVNLAQSTLFDAQLVQRLMFKLQVLPLTKQLTCIAGNIWAHTLKSNRAERTEYLLLHEFHRLKFLPPEKRRMSKRDPKESAKGKAKYSGGLVLEPKKGLYDSFILLLDFNSLYPSIIQEYNLCFTTIDWAQAASSDEAVAVDGETGTPALPALPDASVERGVLPRVIKSLVDRRRTVKNILKSERNPEKQQELDIRQKALKLTANSMYGCLGFSNSRFFAQPIAALVTSLGRETLQRTVDIAQNTVGLEVIYGDTDSIMINTRINDEQDLKKVKELGEKVKKEVNRLYRTLELEIDGIFRSMLLLKKKKYAAKTVEELPNGQGVKYGQELKGLDLVRRDWCIQSKDTGRYVTEQILSGEDSEIVLEKIHTHLEELAKKMRAGELPLEKYTITKGLSKHPNDYPDGKSQPHVQVAKMMLKNNRAVNTGDHIPYIITAPLEQEGEDKPLAKAPSATERARHPEEIARSNGVLKPDVEWYLVQQILPPISRLCEPIDGTSQQILADKLGLDSTRYNQGNRSSATIDDIDVDYTPASFLSDEERFKDVKKFALVCVACHSESEFPGIFSKVKDATGNQTLVSGLHCTNPDCIRPKYWGQADCGQCYGRISNGMDTYVRNLMKEYYEGWVRCDEPSCGLETRQLSVAGGVCCQRGCHGRMFPLRSEHDVYNHLKCLESLFNPDHVGDQLEKEKTFGTKADIYKTISKADRNAFRALHQQAEGYLKASAFNWISPEFWSGLFDIGMKKQ